MDDELGGDDAAPDRGKPGASSGGLGALQNAVREILVAVGDDPAAKASSTDTAKETSGDDSVDDSFDGKQAARWEAQYVHSASRPGRRVNARMVLFVGALSTLLIILTVSFIAWRLQGGDSDVAAKSCVTRDFGAEATVVVTNHGREAASYSFDVVFPQSQSESGSVSVPSRVPTLAVGSSKTVNVYTDLQNSTGTPTCRITNVQRLAGK